MRIEDHDEVIDRHAVKYARPISAWTAVEEVAFGGAMGSNGYLAPDEARALLAALALPGPGVCSTWGRVEAGLRGCSLARAAIPSSGW